MTELAKRESRVPCGVSRYLPATATTATAHERRSARRVLRGGMSRQLPASKVLRT
jgi:hypothetical protein